MSVINLGFNKKLNDDIGVSDTNKIDQLDLFPIDAFMLYRGHDVAMETGRSELYPFLRNSEKDDVFLLGLSEEEDSKRDSIEPCQIDQKELCQLMYQCCQTGANISYSMEMVQLVEALYQKYAYAHSTDEHIYADTDIMTTGIIFSEDTPVSISGGFHYDHNKQQLRLIGCVGIVNIGQLRAPSIVFRLNDEYITFGLEADENSRKYGYTSKENGLIDYTLSGFYLDVPNAGKKAEVFTSKDFAEVFSKSQDVEDYIHRGTQYLRTFLKSGKKEKAEAAKLADLLA